jgi:hypothetical protein
MIGVLVIILLSIILILVLTYPLTANMMGHEVAKRSTFQILVIFLFVISIAFLLYLIIGEKYGLVAFQFLASAMVIFYFLSLPFRKEKAKILLLDIGKNEFWTSSLFAGLMYIGLTISNALAFFRYASTGFPQGSNFVTEISGLAFNGSLSVWWILLALSKTEFRENGIWLGTILIKWQRIKSYRWEPSKPNILTIRHKPSFPLFSGWMSLPIPLQYREDVSRILNERLPNENL